MTAARRMYGWKGGKRRKRRRRSCEGDDDKGAEEGKDDDGEEEEGEGSGDWRTDGHHWIGRRVMREVSVV